MKRKEGETFEAYKKRRAAEKLLSKVAMNRSIIRWNYGDGTYCKRDSALNPRPEQHQIDSEVKKAFLERVKAGALLSKAEKRKLAAKKAYKVKFNSKEIM